MPFKDKNKRADYYRKYSEERYKINRQEILHSQKEKRKENKMANKEMQSKLECKMCREMKIEAREYYTDTERFKKEILPKYECNICQKRRINS